MVSGAHGVRGELRMRLETDVLENLSPGRGVCVGHDRALYEIETFYHTGKPRLKLRGIDTRDAAQGLAGSDLTIFVEDAVPLPPGRFYGAEIIGVDVITVTGERVGVLREILNTGSNDVYVVQGAGREVLVPAIAEVVRDFDAEGRVMTIEMLEGLS